MKRIIFIYYCCFSFSCTNYQVSNDKYMTLSEKMTLSENKQINIELNDITSPISMCIQYIESAEKSPYLLSVNSYNNSIEYYNLTNCRNEKTLKLDKEGDNGVGNIDGFLYLNPDSIYVYSGNISTLTRVNDCGKVYEKHILFYPNQQGDKYYYPSPKVSTNTPIKKYKDNLILTGYLYGEANDENEENSPTIINFNLTDKKITYSNGYPDFYHKYNWGASGSYRMPLYDSHNDKLIISFPADHNLRVYSLTDGTYDTFYGGSNSIKSISCFSNQKTSWLINDEKVYEWYLTNPSYEGIFYDKYNHVYFRIARLPIKHSEVDPFINYNPKQTVIIILDENFNYLGEKKLDNKYIFRPYNIFIDKNGLNIQIRDDENEDFMTFITYKLVDL